LITPSWSSKDLRAALPGVTYLKFLRFYPSIIERMHVEVLGHGNLLPSDMEKLKQSISSWFNETYPMLGSSLDIIQPRAVAMPAGQQFVYIQQTENPNEKDSATVTFFQFGNQNYYQQLIMALLATMLQQPFFNQLRTNEQLGYIVGSLSMEQPGGIGGFEFIVQSNKLDGVGLDARIEAFLVSTYSFYLIIQLLSYVDC
jgi:insulysin